MPKPVILSVDDEPTVLNAITRDLRKKYGEHYRIVRADSGQNALEALQHLQQRQESVALLLVDQRMPQMCGIELLSQAKQLYPDAKRVLLTAYADTNAAIEAINTAAIHYYLLKPWDPPEDQLYPVLDDILADWQASYQPPFQGVRVVAHRWSPSAYQIKEFLARNHIPYQYLDIELDPEAETLLRHFNSNSNDVTLPVVTLPDGTMLENPATSTIAEVMGLTTRAEQPFYDVIIIGAGPAGLAAAVYAASEGLKTVMIEREAPGGQAGSSSRIENYLGFPSGLSGADLARRAIVQARRFGVEILLPQEATAIRIEGPYRIVTLSDGSEISSHVVVLANGLAYRTLNVPGIEKLVGAGVYYGASLSEAIACKDSHVCTVGAGNSAGQAALHLTQYTSHLTMLVRGNSLEAKMSQYLVERIYNIPNINVLVETEVVALHGTKHLEAITYRNNKTGETTMIPTDAIFIFTGAIPCTHWLQDIVACDEHGFVLTGTQVVSQHNTFKDWHKDHPPFMLETSVPGIFAVGDIRSGSIKRVASAVGEGSIAVKFIHEYLSKVR